MWLYLFVLSISQKFSTSHGTFFLVCFNESSTVHLSVAKVTVGFNFLRCPLPRPQLTFSFLGIKYFPLLRAQQPGLQKRSCPHFRIFLTTAKAAGTERYRPVSAAPPLHLQEFPCPASVPHSSSSSASCFWAFLPNGNASSPPIWPSA